MVDAQRIYRKLTDDEKSRHRQIMEQTERDRPELDAKALAKKAELDLLREAFRQLKQQRERKGVALSEVAARSGLDESRLAELEGEACPALNWDILLRVARALGAEVRVGVVAA